MRSRTRRELGVALVLLLACAGTAAVLTGPVSSAATPETIAVTGTTISVDGRGNGHGHGLSQYGARGAAIAGLTTPQILAFYYPGTTLTALPANTIVRVNISNAVSPTTIVSKSGITVVSATGAYLGVTLPTSGTSRYRLVPSGTGLRVESYTNAVWQIVKDGLPSSAYFQSTQGYVRLLRTDGSTDYRGTVGAVRSGSGALTVNRVYLDEYTEGVVPREMPASWQAGAVGAQAVAARSYARNSVENNASAAYDICDSSQCQVYGGMTHYDSAGNVLWNDDPAAIVGNENQVLRYNNATIFAQFSASNGGWTVAGSQPYLTAKSDPYDNTASGDPYLSWTQNVTASSIANYYGLTRLTSIEITARDGNGQWGGRVTAGYVNGVDGSGASQHVATTGFGLQAAMGLRTNWFDVAGAVNVPSAPTGLTATPTDSGATITWAAPSSDGGSAVSGYFITFSGHRISVAASARSSYVGPLVNGVSNTISVQAWNLNGDGAVGNVAVVPQAAPQPVFALTPARMFDTGSSNTLVDPTHPLVFGMPGHAGLPTTAKSVQYALTILHPTSAGILRIHTWGAAPTNTSTIAYPAKVTTTVTVSTPLLSGQRVAYEPSAGSMRLMADIMGYTGPGGQAFGAVWPVTAHKMATVPTGAGVAVPVTAYAGSAATAVVLHVQGATTGSSGWLRVWSGGTAPTVNQVAVSPGGANANTVVVPIGAGGTIRIAASSAGISAQVTVVGGYGPASTKRGYLETYETYPLKDDVVTAGSSVNVGSTAASVRLLGAGQIPSTGVHAVLLQLTVTPPSSGGSLWAWAGGTNRPSGPVTAFGGSRRTMVTVEVPIGSLGTLLLQTSGPGVRVAVDTIAYVN